ncbi:Uncharacterized protein OBRU01_23254 [Operophtera brumata]|uniref:Uncharacterized protein n=1 Tax=Operophtera brumata TaxID=104452 RepID=A0A0L7KP47_OPEBR|nr:Uncharacterized protein OBRU01_23254 [Operophtera brumata]
MNVKKCHVEPNQNPEPPLPDPCKLQRIRLKEKAGVKFCPKTPIEPPQPPPRCYTPPCHALCFERIKNPILPPEPEYPLVCVVEREQTPTKRCDDILDAFAAHPDLPWPGCTPPPLPPPPPVHDHCEELRIRFKKAQCKERMKRYLE